MGAGNTITGRVYVEVDAAPHYALLEAKWAAGQAAYDARLQGIVAAAPVEHGDRMRSYLMALQSIGPLIKGFAAIFREKQIGRSVCNPILCAVSSL
jgi:L-fuconolactonase